MVEVDASLEPRVVDLTWSTGGVESVILTGQDLGLLLERVKQKTHL